MTYDRFAAEIAGIAADLPAGHVSAWAGVLVAAERPGPNVEAALIDARPGYAVAGQARRLIQAWISLGAGLNGAAVALALRTASVIRQASEARRTELVISGPTSPAVAVRLTSSVVIEVLRAARQSLLVVSFAAYGVAEVIAELTAAADRGVRIDLVLEGTAEDGGTLRGRTGSSAAFAELRGRAIFWHWPAHRRSVAGATRAALHAKLIAADTTAALISSANMTDRALSANLEVGVLLRDPDVVARLVRHFAALMGPNNPVLERL